MGEPEIDFLREDEPVDAAPETPEAPPAETVETPETPAPEVPTTPEPHEDRVPKAALIAERRKRQEYEARLRQLEQQNQPPPPNFYEAPDQYVNTLLSQHSQQVTQMMLGALEEQARAVYPDYDEVFAVLQEQAEGNPALATQVMQSPNPALAAYKLGKQLRELQAMRDPGAYRRQIEAEIRAQIAAEQQAKEAARQQAADAIPPDLAAARAAKDNEVPPDDSLDSILASRKR